MLRNVGRKPGFTAEVSKPQGLDPEANPWWWHPGRVGVSGPPPSVEAELDRIDPNLRITKNRYTGNWQVWAKADKLQTKVCWGWRLLFVEDRLGPHIYARLHAASTDRWGSAKQYFDAIQREMNREKELQEKQNLQDTLDQSMEAWDHSRIRVGYGKSSGSKFTKFHS